MTRRMLGRKARVGGRGAVETSAEDVRKFERLVSAWSTVVVQGPGEPAAGDLGVAAAKAAKAVLPLSQRSKDSQLFHLTRLGQQFCGLAPAGKESAIVRARGLLSEIEGVPLLAGGPPPAAAPRRRLDIDGPVDLDEGD